MFCKKTQPTAWECLWRGMTAVFAVIGFFGTLAFLKKKGKKLTKKMEKVGCDCIEACEDLCEDMCDCMSENEGNESTKNGKQSDKTAKQ